MIEATRRGILVVLVIIDKAAAAPEEAGGAAGGAAAASSSSSSSAFAARAEERDSITMAQTVSFRGGQVVRKAYLDDYPFPYYVVVSAASSASLPDVLASALKQWMQIA